MSVIIYRNSVSTSQNNVESCQQNFQNYYSNFFFSAFSNTDGSSQNGDGADNENSNSNFVATIRIASDIIDSTLAHADDHGEQQNDNITHSTGSGKLLCCSKHTIFNNFSIIIVDLIVCASFQMQVDWVHRHR